MTPTRKLSFPLAIVFSILLFCAASAPHAAEARSPQKKKAAAAKTPAKSNKKTSAKDKKTESAKSRASKKETRASKKKEVASKSDRRSSKKEAASKKSRRERDDDQKASKAGRKDARNMSKRERLREARREAERRRREAAERARLAAIARAQAIARQRAADQALRDETAENILKDETTGEDPEVRRAALEALGDKAGTVVVMNPQTGQVYTVVNQNWGLRRGFKPCSTIKLVTGLAGLNERVIDPVQTVNIGTGSFSLDLTDSLALSNNGYFQRVGGEVGFEKMMEYSRKLGLGQPTGINHHFESPGRLPVFKEGWAVNKMSSHGEDIEVTAIQLANMASAIANGGKLLVPHLPRTPVEAVRFKTEVKREVDIPQDHLRRVVPGMIGAVNYGTAKRAYDPLQTVAGKTGSCIENGSWVGLFASYAPVHDPQLAVAVIMRGSGARGKYAAAVAGDIYRRLNHRFGTRPGVKPGLASDMLAPRPKIDLRKAAEVSDEEKDDAETIDTSDAYVVSEADESRGASNAQTNGQTNGQTNLQKTGKTFPRPVSNAAPAQQPVVAPRQQNETPAERPRRVGDQP